MNNKPAKLFDSIIVTPEVELSVTKAYLETTQHKLDILRTNMKSCLKEIKHKLN
jgi:hypothetical protein